MDLPPNGMVKIEDRGPMFHCALFDTEIVHKIAQVFLPGLATACVDNTTGDIFKTPVSVAIDIRKDMIDYLTQRSETFVAESFILEDGTNVEAPDLPFDIISDFVDDFSTLKMNFLSRVSGWLLSEKREDKIDDFVQEMELTGFWLIDRREALAQTLLKNVDFKNLFHCKVKFSNTQELDEHLVHCGFRSLNCESEGCNASFSAAHKEKHDSACPFKIIRCEQKCSESMRRREMDRHCITICPMKLVNCPFYSAGCNSTITQSMNEQHRVDNLHSHVFYILQLLHKDVSSEDLGLRAEALLKGSSTIQLTEAGSVRALMGIVKDLEIKVGEIERRNTKEDSETLN